MKIILLFLSIVVVLLHAKQLFPRIYDNDLKHSAELKKFHHTWSVDKGVSLNDNLFNSKEFAHYDGVSIPQQYFTTGCNVPGYTGAHCEFPICDMPSKPDFNGAPENVMIDFALYPTCNQTMPLFIDDHMFQFSIEIQTSGSYNPFATLFNATGYPVVPTNFDNSDPNRLILVYDRQPSGIYQIYPESDVPSTGCYVQVYGVSQMNIYLGFVQYTGNNRDPERSDFPRKNVNLNTLNLITAHPHNLESPGSIAAITIYQSYNMLSHPQPMNLRYGCNYEYYLNALHCSQTGDYFAKIDGYDFFGNSFRRVVNFKCEIDPNPVPTTTTTISPPVTACKNNGTIISNGNSSYCYCKGLYTGNDCSQTICLNGGTALGNGLCMCQAGYTGDQCQDIRCTDDSGFNFPKDYSVPVFVIRARSQLSTIVNQINTKLGVLADKFQSDPKAFQNFGLVTFNNNGSTFDGQYYTSIEDLKAALLNIANTQDNSGDCMDTTFSAMNYAFNRFIMGNRSPMYVFTDALPSDPEYLQNVIEFNSFILSPIYIFQLEPTNTQCQSLDLFTPAWNALQSVSARSSGNLFWIGSNQYSNVGDLFYAHMYNTYYGSDLMLADDADECLNQQKYSTVSIDSAFERLVIVASGKELDLILTSPEGKFVQPNVAISLNFTSIWLLDGLQTGQWQINLVSGDPKFRCSIRAYSAVAPERASMMPQRKLYWGWTTGLNYDAPLRQPLAGIENSMVLHIDGARIAERHRLSAEIAIYERHDTGKVLSFAANGLWRDECQFEIYFPKYTCHHRDETLYFTVFFRDDNDFMIQRAGAMYCAAFRPTQVPPGTCQNGGFSLNNTCICPPMYTGSVCETPVCYNGGTPQRDFCACVPGFEGTFCEFSTCIATNPENDFGASNKSMVFILDVSNNNAQVLQQLQTYMTEMLRDIASTGRFWINEFNVLGYDQRKTYHLGNGKRHQIDAIATAFSQAYNISLQNTANCDTVRFWETLETAIYLSTNYGYIFNFQTSPPYESVPEIITRTSDFMASKGVQLNSFIASTAKNVYACNSNSDTFKNVKLVSESTEGDAFDIDPKNFQNILTLIPTFYRSGVIYKKVMNDCTSGCYLYYPLDSHTQNSQLFINGAPGQISTQIFMPNLTSLTNMPYLLQDTTTGWSIIEMRRACPSGWNDLGSQYCYTSVSTPMSWTDAKTYCQNNNGFLIDDLSPLKNKFLMNQNIGSFWIGLNDLQVLGSYQWDRGVLEPQVLAPNDFTNWAMGVNLTNPSQRCAYMSQAWYLDDCTTKKQFMCQSHKFMDSFDPNPSEERVLPPGKWSAIITSPGKTIVQIKSQSKIQLVAGYSTNVHDDFPSPNPQSGTSQNMMFAHITSMGSIARTTALVNTQIYDFYNGTMYAAANFQLRIKCAYQFVSEPFACPNSQAVNNGFSSLSNGFDEYGFTFQRMKAAHCVNALTSCSNGGILYDGLCVCNEYWTGQLCDQPICVNNGTLSEDRKSCNCPVGFEGIACEREVCTSNSPDHTNQYGKSFVLVIENTSFNIKAIKQIQSTLPTTLSSVKQGWFTQYVIVVVDSFNKPYLKISTTINDFKAALIDVIPSDSTTACDIPLFNAMTMALHQVNSAKSIFYTVSRAMPSDLNLEIAFATLVAQKQPQFYYHAITGDSGCNVDFTYPITNRLQKYTIASGGNFIATTGATAGSLMSVYIPPMFSGGVLRNPTLMTGTCNSSNLVYFHIDSAVTDVFITMYSTYQSASVISPSGQIEVLKVVYKDTNITSGPKLYVYQVSSIVEFGIYTLSMNGVGTCYVQVKSTGGAEIYVGYVPTPSSTNYIGSHLDNSTSTPLNDYNIIVGKVINDRAVIKYAEILDTYTNELQYIKFYRRSNCTHNLYSDPFKCSTGTLLIKYFGNDISGTPFTRDSFTLCLQNGIPTPSIPTIIPPINTTTPISSMTTTTTTTPTPSSLKTDVANVYLIIDTSSAVPSSSYAVIFSNFIASIFVQYNINPKYINIALSGSPGDNNIWLTNPTFNTYTSLGMLKNIINSTYYPIDGPQSSGQSQLSQILGQATNNNFLSTGYTSGSIPHLIFYITTSSTPNSDAINVGQTIINSKTFQIISIAYGNNLGNVNSLSSMSNCVYNPMIMNDLNTLAGTISNKISNAYNNNGIYVC
ncbi:Epidermal growth factor-like domain and C-type lectin domain and von Willebrand factor, type A domain and MD domain and C-type lectin-like domain and C-type lectin fold domain-containing protein [Strongyloides ratti]|uniref:Epidermal growth factor-like domain and C-type lectin domain and von Willebrand factor, type A domain and MD domain and C-type lectin-like domain and C-type lectin fold domain-containing protein n=1 Tax=Strongyloides ratti TaxID=34506 RepID=A0A090KTW8_STRRB|nr:Epidermal growth factor-like domain and C-type lectin domain and von Willebrand factor, type A domain and MD domain and C-type lectin-like domain and C-type lectin fold domain-containing protein [Strongyloides ratti]CEF59295.1 Epidermal growth factor-like domain and C-type lectin domain and von Willebrand factor, type A domain and MD domain and C-type lectin-like domain and C-type lectin fold domain-containing protein [Strongyloides ratti]